MKPCSYRAVNSGDQSAVYRLDVVATFVSKELADDFALLKNGFASLKNGGPAEPPAGAPYAVDTDGCEFYVTQARQLAIFFDAELAVEYAEMKTGREVRQQQIIGGRPDGTAASVVAPVPPQLRQEEPIDMDAIWAAAAGGDVTRV